ncbi:MAG: hypothetical protein KF760_01360 [Candidatus Eremiobacteraeota bacterium]|nr:hypothetical protein [Candidatus Eremiobacteraeota bacterium]MCW5869785.1 hypothetical protein [Candidatus Eremiobacteraeota bacterium]
MGIREFLQRDHATISTFPWMAIYNAPFQPSRFFHDILENLYRSGLGCLGTAWLLLLAVWLWQGSGTAKILEYFKRPWFCPLLAFVLALLVRAYAMFNFDAISDEAGFTFQAQVFCSGHWTAPAPPSYEHFAHPAFRIYRDRWAYIGAPGWSLVLALGHLLSIPNLISPLILAGTILLMQALSRRWHGPEAAAWTGALALGSPTIMLSGSSNFSHLAAAFWAMATLNCLERVRPGNFSWSFASGLCLGLTSSTRMVEGAVLCGVLFVWRVILPPATYRRPSFAQVLTLAAGLACGLFPLLAQNHAITGHPLVSAYEVHGAVRSFQEVELSKRFHLAFLTLNRMMFWASPLLLELTVLTCWRSDRRIWFILLFLAPNAWLFAHPEMIGIGIRYVLPCLVVLTSAVGSTCSTLFSRWREQLGSLLPFYFLFVSGAVYPDYIRACSSVYSDRLALDVWLRQAIGPDGIGILRFDPINLGMGFTVNRPDLQGPIRVVSLGPEEDALLARAFPHRRVMYLDFDQQRRQLVPVPFDRTQDDFTRLCGGAHYANEVENPQKALELWRQIPQESPWKQAALGNSIRILKRLGREQEARATEEQLKAYQQGPT